MAGDALGFVEDLDDLGADTYIEHAPHPAMGDAVEVLFDLDMVINAGLGAFPFGVLIGRIRQGFERGLIE